VEAKQIFHRILLTALYNDIKHALTAKTSEWAWCVHESELLAHTV